jgi:hypothetical protein
MADPNADLLQQLTQAGLYPQQIAQLQRQYQLAQGFMQPQEAQGRQVGGTYVASSPLEHLSNALRPVIGAYMQRQAMNREGELTGQLSSGRQAFARALQDSSGHPGELMPGGAGDQQRMQQLSMLGALSGDPGMQHASQMYMQEQNQGRQMALLENTLRHQQETERQGRDRIGVSQERVDQMNQQLAMRGIRYDPNLNKFVDIRPMAGVKPQPRSALPLSTGAAPAAPPSAPPSGGGGGPPPGPPAAPLGKWQDKALKDLGNDFNPANARGEYGKNYSRTQAAKRVMALAVDEAGNPKDLNPQQMAELAQSVASLIGGSSAAQAQIEHLLPSSYTRDLAGIQQYLTSEPHGAGQVAFVKANVELAKREAQVAQQGIEDTRKLLGTKHQRILTSNPNEARKTLQSVGWDIGPDGVPVLAQQPKPAAGPSNMDAIKKKYGL